MRRMYTEKQLTKLVKAVVENSSNEVVEALIGQDISIANASITGDLAVHGNLVAGTLIQQSPNYIGEIVVRQNTLGLTYTERYCKCVQFGNVLYVVVSFKLQNETEEATSSGQILFRIKVGATNGQKIYTINGQPLSDETAGSATVCNFELKRGSTLTTAINSYMFRGNTESLDFYVQVPALNAGASEQFEGRQFLILLENEE